VIDLAFITYNRLEYTRRSLASILADPAEDFSLTIWDNASTDGTAEYLKTEVRDPRIKDIVCSKTNIGQVPAVNKIWSQSHAELLGKLDNDCLMTPGWTRILAQAHHDIPKLGIVACFHFFESDFDFKRAEHKIQTFGPHRILRHPWTCGTGFLIKRSVYQECGPITGSATTDYWIKLARRGYINGFYYPLIFQEHMDDPKSRYCQLKDQAAIRAAKGVTVTPEHPKVQDVNGLFWWREEVLSTLLDEPWDVRYYVGWRNRLRRLARAASRLGQPKPAPRQPRLAN
jgi:glycosyltransferase involved in cell wall biosynthesis